MNLSEIILICAGLSLDVFAVLVCRGALISCVEKKRMGIYCLIFGIAQVCLLVLGNLVTWIPFVAAFSGRIEIFWKTISSAIFALIGVYLLSKAIAGKPFFESRDDSIQILSLIVLALLTGLDAFFAGIGFAILDTSLQTEMIAMLIITLCAVITGVYTGYRLGSEQRTKAYAIGGILLVIAAVESFLRFRGMI